MTTPNTEPKPSPATDAEIVTMIGMDRRIYKWEASLLARIEQEREMRRELHGAVDALLGPFRVREHLRDNCFRCKAEATLARAAKMEADNAR